MEMFVIVSLLHLLHVYSISLTGATCQAMTPADADDYHGLDGFGGVDIILVDRASAARSPEGLVLLARRLNPSRPV